MTDENVVKNLRINTQLLIDVTTAQAFMDMEGGHKVLVQVSDALVSGHVLYSELFQEELDAILPDLESRVRTRLAARYDAVAEQVKRWSAKL
jgi:hypothetical protein